MRANQGRAAYTCGEQGGQLVVHDDDPEWTQFLMAEIDVLNTGLYLHHFFRPLLMSSEKIRRFQIIIMMSNLSFFIK